MELERELKDMDMALELGNSIASLDARTQSRLKNSIVDGSFMVVPGSESYMASSNMWSSSTQNHAQRTTNQNAKNNIVKQNQAAQARATAVHNASAQNNARKNRVQNLLQASAHHPVSATGVRGMQPHAQYIQQQAQHHGSKAPELASPSPGLESSWWGSSSTSSQVLASSVISLGASSICGGTSPGESVSAGDNMSGNQPAANTKQLMRLMDALKTLGDENANLLREVEAAEAARMEAKASKEQMSKFKAEYAKRFTALKAALEKFRRGHPENAAVESSGEHNPITHRYVIDCLSLYLKWSFMVNWILSHHWLTPCVLSKCSNYMQSASTSEQLQRQEQLIRKLTADLKREKEESKKKDAALRKYESFYREVKARSAQKAAQRQKDGLVQRPLPPQQSRRAGQR